MKNQPLSQNWKLSETWHTIGFALLLSLAFFVFTTASVQASPQVTFNGTGVGAIPDQADPNAPCQTPSTPLNVTFNVSGLTGNVQTVSVTITFSPSHTWGGDVVATLIAPNGSTQLDLFGYTGATTAGGSGDSSDLAGPYTFTDTATGTSWWAAAAAAGSTAPIPSGSYRTSQRGGAGSTGANTSLNAVFGGLTPAQANGTWTLRLTDGCNGDTGGVGSATLDITTATVAVTPKPFFDFYGSGRTSFATVAAQGSNIVWRLRNNGGTGTDSIIWGLAATDTPSAGYFDADNRADISVYRPGTANSPQGYYYTRQTTNTTLLAQPFGTTGDFGNYHADYDGDGRDDYTIVRRVSGQWHWIYLSSQNNTIRTVPFGTANGTATEDVPTAGMDYTGDGRADLCVIRLDASNNATYLIGDSQTGAVTLAQPWGNFNSDYVVLGDFLGDARADFAVWRAVTSGSDAGTWYIKENGGNGFYAPKFGIPGATGTRDVAVVGDYNGDGKSDVAVYRQSNATFYWLNSPNTGSPTIGTQQFGVAGDIPLASFRTY